jgi:hypothetical protein
LLSHFAAQTLLEILDGNVNTLELIMTIWFGKCHVNAQFSYQILKIFVLSNKSCSNVWLVFCMDSDIVGKLTQCISTIIIVLGYDGIYHKKHSICGNNGPWYTAKPSKANVGGYGQCSNFDSVAYQSVKHISAQ